MFERIKNFLRPEEGLIESIKDLVRQEEGLTIVEYAVAAGLITLLVAAAFKNLGLAVMAVINGIIGFI